MSSADWTRHPGRGRPGLAAVLLLPALSAALALGPGRGARAEASASTTLVVRSDVELAAAVERLRSSGGTIVLRPGRYEHVVLGPRGPGRLTIRALPGASAGTVRLVRTRDVALVGLRVQPRWEDATVQVFASRWIDLRRLTVVGRSGLWAGVDLEYARGVTIRDSRFSRCGEGHACLTTGRSNSVRVLDNRFHDCDGCDFIRGSFGRWLTIRGNRFDRSLVGACGSNPTLCNHQDLVELHRGRFLVIERNVFGVYQLPGGGQVALFGPLADVHIRNNLFLARDGRAPGVVAHVAVNLGGLVGLPRRVVIANNTILAGQKRPDRWCASSIRLKPSYLRLRRSQRPVLANNVVRYAGSPRILCNVVRLSTANVFAAGRPCSRTDVVASARLDRRGWPTRVSSPLIDCASRSWAPLRDLTGARRDRKPDIGAVEHLGARRTTRGWCRRLSRPGAHAGSVTRP